MGEVEKRRILGVHFRDDGKPKRKFLSLRSAQQHIRDHHLEGMVAYKCTFCGGHHLATEKTDKT